jgi:hypothetical protein
MSLGSRRLHSRRGQSSITDFLTADYADVADGRKKGREGFWIAERG